MGLWGKGVTSSVEDYVQYSSGKVILMRREKNKSKI